MKQFTNLKAFLQTDVRVCKYKYRMSTTRSNRVFLGNKLYKDFAKDTVTRIKIVHDEICNELMIRPLPGGTWETMQKRIIKKCLTLKPKEKLQFVVYYELDDAYELTMEVETIIK